jgi:hypothetical protein
MIWADHVGSGGFMMWRKASMTSHCLNAVVTCRKVQTLYPGGLSIAPVTEDLEDCKP